MHDSIAVPYSCEQSGGAKPQSQAGLFVLLTAVRVVAASAAQSNGSSEPNIDDLKY